MRLSLLVQAGDGVRDGAVESVGIGKGAVHGCTPRTAAISPARRPSSVSRIARARSASSRCSDFDRARNAACSAASAVSVDFPGIPGLHNPPLRKTANSIAPSQAARLEPTKGLGVLVERVLESGMTRYQIIDITEPR